METQDTITSEDQEELSSSFEGVEGDVKNPDESVDSEIIDSEPLQLSSRKEHIFNGIPEADWRSVTQEEMMSMSIPELHGLHIDTNQKYLLVRMLASSKPVTLQDMHDILSDADKSLSYADKHWKINALRLDGTIRLMSQRVAGYYMFEVNRKV